VTPPAHDVAVAVGGLDAPRLDTPRPAWVESSLAVVLAGVLALGLAAVGPGVDSAAHAYQLEQFSAHGWRLWDNYWYAGRYELVNYSLLFYPLASLVGQLLLVVCSVAGTAGLFAAIVLRQWGPSARFSARAFALSWPALIVVFIFEFKASWMNLLDPLIYLRSDSQFTIPRGLYALLGVYGPSAGGHGDYQVIIAAMVVATLPLILLFFVGQKYFIEQGGIATQGRKG
jgi:hypothetical protein